MFLPHESSLGDWISGDQLLNDVEDELWEDELGEDVRDELGEDAVWLSLNDVEDGWWEDAVWLSLLEPVGWSCRPWKFCKIIKIFL